MKNQKKGFTLIELLIVIAIIAVLAAIIFVAVDPAKRGAQSRDARRSAEVTSILNAVMTYIVDEEVSDVTDLGLNTTAQDLGANDPDLATLEGYLAPEYLATIPKDPTLGYYYQIKQAETGSNRITVCAPHSERVTTDCALGTGISVSR